MAQGRLSTYVERIRTGLYGAFAETHTPREMAGSFALGAFITMLPTFGLGLVVFVLLVAISDRVSKLALVASVVVFNPPVKWAVYVASFALGVFLLGPAEGASVTEVSLSAGPAVVSRLLLGNLILAIVAAIVSYVGVYRLAVRYRATDVVETLDEVLDDIAEEVQTP